MLTFYKSIFLKFKCIQEIHIEHPHKSMHVWDIINEHPRIAWEWGTCHNSFILIYMGFLHWNQGFKLWNPNVINWTNMDLNRSIFISYLVGWSQIHWTKHLAFKSSTSVFNYINLNWTKISGSICGFLIWVLQ